MRAGLELNEDKKNTIELELITRKLMVLDVTGFPIQRQWYLVYRQGKRLSPSARAFRQFVLSEARQLAAETPGWMPAATPPAAL